ncbi:MAG: HAD family hydrolase [Candidatus Bathyarchaeia archaeon]
MCAPDKKPQVKAVLFDLGGTLVYTTEIPEVYKRMLEAHGIKRSIEEISHAHEETEKHLDIQKLATLFEEYWIRWNLQILGRLGIEQNVRALAETIADRWWDYSDVELYPDVEETLQQLREMGLKIGIVTNGLESDYRQVLQKVGLLDFFDVTVGIDTVGKMKPHRDIFLHALKKLEVSPSETLFVGDRLEEDYEGARRAGLRPLLIDRDNVISSKVEKIRSFKEIANYFM